MKIRRLKILNRKFEKFVKPYIRPFNYTDEESPYDYYEFRKRRKRFNQLVSVAAVALAISAIVSIPWDWERIIDDNNLTSMYTESERYPIAVYVLDSGSANCVLVHSEEANILIDCGKEKADKNVLDMLDILDVDTLNLVILTHPDKDHIGNLEQVTDTVNVERFVTCENGDYELSELYGSLVSKLREKNIDIETVKSGDKISFGELTLDVVSPIMVYDTSNNNSVVVKLRCKNFTALLTGDIGKKAEEDIVESGADISANVLLVPHHGSGSSTTEEFLKAVNPKYAIISVEQSEYLPNDGTLTRLINFGCEIYRTDVSGNIIVVSDGEACSVMTEYDKISRSE